MRRWAAAAGVGALLATSLAGAFLLQRACPAYVEGARAIVVSIDNCPPCEVLESMLEPIMAQERCRPFVGWVKHRAGGEVDWEYPTVVGVVRGEEVERFAGMRPEPELRAFLDRLLFRAKVEADLERRWGEDLAR